MKKLTLQIDDLRVESFTTSQAGANVGTVEAFEFYTESCRPDPASRCGPNVCDPFTEPTTGGETTTG